MKTILSGYRKIISFALFAGTLLYGLTTSLGSDNASVGMIFAAFAPTLGTGFGALMWAFRAGYQRDGQIGEAQLRAPIPPTPPPSP
jgi:hypothetical protein